MSYDSNDRNVHDPEREEREAREQEAYEERLAAFRAGLCSRRAAISGGAIYLHDLAETAMELKEAGCAVPAPVAASSARTSTEPNRERSAA
jgi:nitrogenase molybdenum-iron protein alpha/beta subunit